ncbi:hypothetical protein ACGFZC_34960 [[Kitasatospora] papulosa]|uniref:hypothetical protein n=1 Tax=[Kitasatospora] papulosa TaxID=1464011 RepID=UPI003722AF88
MGEYRQAADLHRQVLYARERTLGPEHPHTLSSRSNLMGGEARLARIHSRKRRWPRPHCYRPSLRKRMEMPRLVGMSNRGSDEVRRCLRAVQVRRFALLCE